MTEAQGKTDANVPEEDALIIEGNDGVLYSIPIADLERYRIPDDKTPKDPLGKDHIMRCKFKCRY